jgi:hypothetical protein
LKGGIMEKLIRTISKVSKKFLDSGSIGFSTEEDGPAKWYNIKGDPEVIAGFADEMLNQGNVVEFEYDGKVATKFTLKEKAKPKEKNWADDMTNLDDLLDAAHKKGVISIETEIIQIDVEKKFAVFKATVKGWIGEDDKKAEKIIGKFTGTGDAENIKAQEVGLAWIRMAETRSIVRALRWYTNNANVAIEETGGESGSDKQDEVPGEKKQD